jgi:CheY-like chemotaxis protein
VSSDRNYDRRVPKDADDEVGAVADAFNDMLARIKARDEELQHALRLKDEFLATVSHELRTPLNAMLGWSHVLRDPRVTPEMTRQAVDAIDRNARWQASLIEDILDVSRMITGKLRLEPRPTDLTAIVLAAVDVVKPSADAKKITIQTALLPSAGFVGDSDRLRQVVWNILSNAVKFTPQNGLITVTLTEEPREYSLEVTDSGRGISPDFLPFIFQPFRQADGSTTRSQGGLGLGLAIARHLTELSGGSIQATSEGLNRGATFTIRLPRQSDSAPIAVSEERPVTQRWSDLEGFQLLVVDDNEDTRNVLATMLEAHGATITTAASVADARAALAHRLPDVLITDLAMPVEDGFGLLEYCRHHTDPKLRTLPILALTAYGGQQSHDRVIAAGFDAYLAKPVEPVEVGRVVRDLATRKSSSAP